MQNIKKKLNIKRDAVKFISKNLKVKFKNATQILQGSTGYLCLPRGR